MWAPATTTFLTRQSRVLVGLSVKTCCEISAEYGLPEVCGVITQGSGSADYWVKTFEAGASSGVSTGHPLVIVPCAPGWAGRLQ